METEKVQIPISPSSEVMSLLIKANNFLKHAQRHALLKSDFDKMIAIHSLDNSIEYILRIIIKHLGIEEHHASNVNSIVLTDLFNAVNSYIKNYTTLEGKNTSLPYRNEIGQIRNLRNNVQHGLILPVEELGYVMKYGNLFFEKVLKRIFCLLPNQISFSTLIDNPLVKPLLELAEIKIQDEKYLESIVASRDAFELARFLYQDSPHRTARFPALASLKRDFIDLYYYLSQIDDDIFILSSKISMDEYRKFTLYLDHIPSEYNAQKRGYRLMQREWERDDAIFCCDFASRTILSWQMDAIDSLYEPDLSAYPELRRSLTINGISIPELYIEKTCMYGYGKLWGELFYITDKEKEMFELLAPGDVIKYDEVILHGDLIWKSSSDFKIIRTIDTGLVLNSGSLWAVIMQYENIPFTGIVQGEEHFEIENIFEDITESEMDISTIRELLKLFLAHRGGIDNVGRAFEFNEQLLEKSIEHSLVSSRLIENLSRLVIYGVDE